MPPVCFLTFCFILQAGVIPPSDVSLRSWKSAVEGLSVEAFKTLEELSQSSDEAVDFSANSLAFITRDEFRDLEDDPTAQSLILNILARYGKDRF